jgi:DNA-binding GntR family transcriptional regulator
VERGPETPSERVETEIRALLAEMHPGQALPPVRELATRYNVSTATVSKALARLRESGDIQSRPGWGTFKS